MLKDSLVIKERTDGRKVPMNENGSTKSKSNFLRTSALTSFKGARSSIKSSLGTTAAGAGNQDDFRSSQ